MLLPFQRWGLVVAVASLLMTAPTSAWAQTDKAQARAYYDKATAAFALGQYAEAAEDYERAFKLKPDPALLYNAAQAHRLGGNKKRALELYRSYLRVFPDGAARVEAEKQVNTLSQASEPSAPPPQQGLPTPPPVEVKTAPPPVAKDPRPAHEGSVMTSAAPPASEPPRPLTSRPIFWVAVGVVAVAAIVGIGLAASGDEDPSPTLGRIGGMN